MNQQSQIPDRLNMKSQQVLVGVGAILLRNNKVLLGQRIGSHGAGSWALPGGHLEFTETVEQCATREVKEETGLDVLEFKSAPYTNDIFISESRHYVTLFVVADSFHGEPEVIEADKCLGWHWCDWKELPKPLFQPLQTLLDSGFVPA